MTNEVAAAKALMDYISAFGMPGGLTLALLAFWYRNRQAMPHDPAKEVMEAVKKLGTDVATISRDMSQIREDVREMKAEDRNTANRLTKVETRQDMMLNGSAVVHWNDKTRPPVRE